GPEAPPEGSVRNGQEQDAKTGRCAQQGDLWLTTGAHATGGRAASSQLGIRTASTIARWTISHPSPKTVTDGRIAPAMAFHPHSRLSDPGKGRCPGLLVRPGAAHDLAVTRNPRRSIRRDLRHRVQPALELRDAQARLLVGVVVFREGLRQRPRRLIRR